MRLISSDGTYDVPYEAVVVQRVGNEITVYASTDNVPDSYIFKEKYLIEESARLNMECMRLAYEQDKKSFWFT